MGGAGVMRPAGVAVPSAPQLTAAGATGLAEAAVLCLPVHALLTGASPGSWPLAVAVAAFLVSYAASVTLVCRYREARAVPAVVAAVAIALGVLTGGGLTPRGMFTVVVFLLVGVRVVSLGFRDWDEPTGRAFLLGAVAIGAEALIGSSAGWGWDPALVALIALFFVASLVARAVNVWHAGDAADLTDPGRERSLGRTLTTIAWLPGAMIAAVVLGAEGGALDRLGSLLAPLGNAIAAVLVWGFAQLARPVFWLVDRLGIDPEGVRRVFARLQANADAGRERAQERIGHPSLLGRTIALLLVGLAVWGLVRLLRRLRPEPTAAGTAFGRDPGVAVTTAPGADEPGPPARGRTRRAPPADRVRRWYQETLRALERNGLAKPPSLTPAEFVPEVAQAYPGSADAFRALTGAYEDVRYGRLSLDAAALKRLDRQCRALRESLRRRPPVP